MLLDNIKDIGISNKLAKEAWLNNTKVWFKDSYNIPQSIRDAMVLWYDIEKQGATNESMAVDPTLKDLSGNGRDATCYNFAWSGMSGIGGTNSPFFQTVAFTDTFIENGGLKATYNGEYAGDWKTFGSQPVITDKLLEPNDIIVSNYKEEYGTLSLEYSVTFSDESVTKIQTSIKSDGKYSIDLSQLYIPDDAVIKKIQTFRLYFGDLKFNCENLIIEQIPKYPNALVSDGVNDYAYVERLPILTDYTVIAKRKWLELSSNFIALASKTDNVNNAVFLFEWTTKDLFKRTSSFGGTNTFSDWWNDIITYQTKREYNGTALILKNEELTDTDNMTLLSLNRYGFGGKIALYSFLLFNRTLTKNEIEWVKTNLINGYPTPNVYYDCSLYTNETIDSTNPVLKDLSSHGHDLVLNNFAFAGMSGFGGYVFDAGNLTTLVGYRDAVSIVGNKITLNSKPQGSIASDTIFANAVTISGEVGQSVNINIPAFKIKVSGLPDGTTLSYGYSTSTNSTTSYNWLGSKSFGNGITEIPAINTTLTPDSEADYCSCNPCRLMFGRLADEESFSDITIEILPEYENALVFDGVDDYGIGTRDSFDKCTMLMLFKPTAQQDGISVDFRDKYSGDFAIYRNDYIEPHIAYNARNVNGTYVNNKLNSTLTITDIINKKQLITVKGKILNTDDFCIGSNNTHDGYFDRMALYKFLLFDQELTQEQIDKVIQDYHLMDDIDDVWNQ